MGKRAVNGRPDGGRWVRPGRDQRRTGNRQVRHDTRAALHQLPGDPEGMVLPEPAGSGARVDTADHLDRPVGARRFRHWKQPFWKRRTNARIARARAAQTPPTQ